MIELNGIYTLKHIKGFNGNYDYKYKVVAFNEDKSMVGCVQLEGDEVGKQFVFMTECIYDPEKPEDKYFGEIIKQK